MKMSQPTRPTKPSPQAARARHGIATLLALMSITLTLSICVALLRTQTTARLIQHNVERSNRAQEAAETGLHAGLARMHHPSWPGVGVTLPAVVIDSDTAYQVSYVAGDASLSPGDPGYHLRVTIESRGTCASAQGGYVDAYAEAVVQLIPRGVATEPAGWSQLAGATVLHWGTNDLDFELPTRVEGVLRTHGSPKIAPTTPPDFNQPFEGRIDELAIWSRALSGGDISSLLLDAIFNRLANGYSSESPDSWWRFTETSGDTVANESNGPDGEVIGALLNQNGSPGETGNRAASFDGHNDQIRAADDGNFNNLSIVAWINESGAGDGTRSCIVGRGSGPTDDRQSWSFSVVDVAGTRRLEFRLRANGVTQTLTDASTAILPNTWYFVAATYDGANMRIYSNGFERASLAHTGTPDDPPNAVLTIGDQPPGSARAAYLRGLKDELTFGLADKALVGSVETPLTGISSLDQDLITNVIGATVADLTGASQEPAPFSAGPTTYQLYSGGPVYSAVALSGFYSNRSFGPTSTNPLGVFVASNDVQFGSNVSLQGTLIVEGSLDIDGQNVAMSPVALPPLDGAAEPIELPVAVLERDLDVADQATADLRGLVMAWSRVRLRDGADGMFNLTGLLATARLQIRPRADWSTVTSWWAPRMAQWSYDDAMRNSSDTFPYFLESYSHSVAPEAIFTPSAQAKDYHWTDWTGPLFLPQAGDDHLRWSVVRWRQQ